MRGYLIYRECGDFPSQSDDRSKYISKGIFTNNGSSGMERYFFKAGTRNFMYQSQEQEYISYSFDWLIHNKSLTPFEPGQDKFTWDTDCCCERDITITRSYGNCLFPKEQNLQSGQMHISGTVWTLLGKRHSRCKCVIDYTFYSWWRCLRLCRRRFWSRFSNILALMIL